MWVINHASLFRPASEQLAEGNVRRRYRHLRRQSIILVQGDQRNAFSTPV